MLNVLHVWDQAGVASVISKYQKRLGHNVQVLQQAKHDTNDITKLYGGHVSKKNKLFFVFVCLSKVKNYDIIHLHDAWWLIHLVHFFYPKKKMILHYHGSMVRYLKPYWKRKLWEKYVDKIIVSTPDLLSHKYFKKPIYVPNPVDTELFKRKNPTKYKMAFTALKHDQSTDQLDSLLSEHGLNLVLATMKRDQRRIKHGEFPSHLEQYEYYIDVPMYNGQIIPAHSICGLQAMALGVKTVAWDFTISDKLPDEHKPEKVVDKLMEVYAKT